MNKQDKEQWKVFIWSLLAGIGLGFMLFNFIRVI